MNGEGEAKNIGEEYRIQKMIVRSMGGQQLKVVVAM